jgi:hypothetical protein
MHLRGKIYGYLFATCRLAAIIADSASEITAENFSEPTFSKTSNIILALKSAIYEKLDTSAKEYMYCFR